MAKYFMGFIGTGTMGGTLAKAACVRVEQDRCIALADASREKAEALAGELGCTCADNADVARDSKFLFFGVKPQYIADMLSGIAPVLAARKDGFVLVTMAAGVTIAKVRELLGADYPIIRIMPNTPCAIGKGMVLYTSDGVSEDDLSDFLAGMDAAGSFDCVPEKLIDAGSAISGCGPAFVYMMIDALADGGVACGLTREKAVLYAAETVIGAGSMAIESGLSPSALKEAVCSPGGSTIAGVKALEDRGFRGALMEAAVAAYNKTKELG